MTTTSIRVSEAARDRLMQVAATDYGDVSADAALTRLLDEHWERQAVEAVERYAREDPEGWADYLQEAEELDRASAPPVDRWEPAA